MSEHVHSVPDAPQATHSPAAVPSGSGTPARLSEAEMGEIATRVAHGQRGMGLSLWSLMNEVLALRAELDAAIGQHHLVGIFSALDRVTFAYMWQAECQCHWRTELEHSFEAAERLYEQHLTGMAAQEGATAPRPRYRAADLVDAYVDQVHVTWGGYEYWVERQLETTTTPSPTRNEEGVRDGSPPAE